MCHIITQIKLLIRISGKGGKDRLRYIKIKGRRLSTLPTDTTGQLDVFGHDGDTLGVDGAQVGVLKQTNQVSLAGLLQTKKS